jgi:NitT/TauT family transport system substrate-binding protein
MRGTVAKKLLLGVILIILWGCSSARNPSRPPLKIGLVTWIGYGPFYVAQEKGFFAENNVNVQLERIEGDVERRAAIASGRLDGIALTLDAMIVLRTNGIPLKTLMAIDVSNGGDGIVAIKAIQSVEDLKGRQIAFPTGLPSHFFLYSALKSRNLDIADIKPIPMDADAAGSAFASGKLDAAVTWEPWLSKASEVGRGHILIDSRQLPGKIQDVLFMREEVVAQRSAEIESLIKAWYQAVNFTAAHPQEAQAIMAKALGIPSDKVAKLVAGIRYQDRQGNRDAFGTPTKPGLLYGLYDEVSDAWLKEHVINKRDRPEDGLDPDFVRRIP